MVRQAEDREKLAALDGKSVCTNQGFVESDLFMLGEMWLRSITAVLDVGAAELRFAKRSY
jgi:hypothetical protein